LTDEADSFMFQTVGHNVINAYAEAMRLPLFRIAIQGNAVCTDLHYQPPVLPNEQDEVESLYLLLQHIKRTCVCSQTCCATHTIGCSMPEIEAVSSGAILSDYQRHRVENVCVLNQV
jgi:diphthine-ammonia ligase